MYIKSVTLVISMLCYSSCSLSYNKKGYIPDGLSQSQWEKIKYEEKKAKSKNYAVSGVSKGFKSRSLNEFLELKEKGLTDYNMPVFNAREKLLKGIITEKDIPYMQRKNGKPDDSDLKFKFFDNFYENIFIFFLSRMCKIKMLLFEFFICRNFT